MQLIKEASPFSVLIFEMHRLPTGQLRTGRNIVEVAPRYWSCDCSCPFRNNKPIATYRDLPDKLKIAKVIPLFKKRNEALIENYWSISLLSSIWNIFERIVLYQLYKYLDDNNYMKLCMKGTFRFLYFLIYPKAVWGVRRSGVKRTVLWFACWRVEHGTCRLGRRYLQIKNGTCSTRTVLSTCNRGTY